MYMYDLQFTKHNAILSLPQECDGSRTGSFILHKPRNRGSPASSWLSQASSLSLHSEVPSTTPYHCPSSGNILLCLQRSFCLRGHWVWFSESYCRWKGCSLLYCLQEWRISESPSAEECLNKLQAVHSGNTIRLLRRMWWICSYWDRTYG